MKIKKYIAALILAAAVMILSVPAAMAAEYYFEDAADLYDSAEEIYIQNLLKEACEHTGWNYGIVTMEANYYSMSSAGIAAEEIYDREFGRDSSGVLFLCDVGYRYVVVAGEAREYVTGSRFDNMMRKMKEEYFDYRDLACAKTFIERTTKYYDRGKGSFDVYPPAMAIAVILGLAAAGFTAYGVNRSYNTHEKPSTNNYLDVRNVNMYRRDDRLVHVYTRTYSNRSSGHYGGSRGGGGFGGHHGGGGFGGRR